jgi:hypothetical protein
MADNADFKRLHYFTGLFLTADDFNLEQEYFLRKRWLHNRGLHTPGVIPGTGEDDNPPLTVKAAGDLNLRVRPGAAIDAAGHEICLWDEYPLAVDLTLPAQAYVTLSYASRLTDSVEIKEGEKVVYSGDARVAEIPHLKVTATPPDNLVDIELARITLPEGAQAIKDAGDPGNPKAGEIDLRYVKHAGAMVAAPPPDTLPPELAEGVITLMQETRLDFADLDRAFPIPATEDVRHAAVTVEFMARSGGLRPAQLPGVIAGIAAIEQAVGTDLGQAYEALSSFSQYDDYLNAVEKLRDDLNLGTEAVQTLLDDQNRVALAAEVLSRVSLHPPVADAGADQTVTAAGAEATVVLDASKTEVFGNRKAVYRWDLKSSALPPVANAGIDRTVSTPGDEASVVLDGGGSQASGGREVVEYRWDEKSA